MDACKENEQIIPPYWALAMLLLADEEYDTSNEIDKHTKKGEKEKQTMSILIEDIIIGVICIACVVGAFVLQERMKK